MKYGMRKPSISKSIKARTTGKINRSLNKSLNPLYGKKGMGYIKNPQKAIYNSIYNKTTLGVKDIITNNSKTKFSNIDNSYCNKTQREKNKWISILLCMFTFCGHKFYEGKIGLGILYFFTIGFFRNRLDNRFNYIIYKTKSVLYLKTILNERSYDCFF